APSQHARRASDGALHGAAGVLLTAVVGAVIAAVIDQSNAAHGDPVAGIAQRFVAAQVPAVAQPFDAVAAVVGGTTAVHVDPGGLQMHPHRAPEGRRPIGHAVARANDVEAGKAAALGHVAGPGTADLAAVAHHRIAEAAAVVGARLGDAEVAPAEREAVALGAVHLDAADLEAGARDAHGVTGAVGDH